MGQLVLQIDSKDLGSDVADEIARRLATNAHEICVTDGDDVKMDGDASIDSCWIRPNHFIKFAEVKL